MRKNKSITIILAVLVFTMGLTGCGFSKKSLNLNLGKDSAKGTTHEETVTEEKTQKNTVRNP